MAGVLLATAPVAAGLVEAGLMGEACLSETCLPAFAAISVGACACTLTFAASLTAGSF